MNKTNNYEHTEQQISSLTPEKRLLLAQEYYLIQGIGWTNMYNVGAVINIARWLDCYDIIGFLTIENEEEHGKDIINIDLYASYFLSGYEANVETVLELNE